MERVVIIKKQPLVAVFVTDADNLDSELSRLDKSFKVFTHELEIIDDEAVTRLIDQLVYNEPIDYTGAV